MIDVPASTGQARRVSTPAIAPATIAATPMSGRPTATASTGPPMSRTPNHSQGRAIASVIGSRRRGRPPRGEDSTMGSLAFERC